MKHQSKNYLTYTTLRKIAGMNIPGPLQNMYLRNYCNNNNINFSLPIEEYIFDGCYIELYGILDKFSKDYSGLITFSIHCLPDDQLLRNEFLKKVIKKKKEVHFIFEKIILRKINDIDYIDLLLKLHEKNSQSIKVSNVLRNFI